MTRTISSFLFALVSVASLAAPAGAQRRAPQPIQIDSFSSTGLFGVVDPESTNALLEPEGLELALIGGQALGAIVVNDYEETSIGRFKEFYLTFFVKPLGASADRLGLVFFSLSTDDFGVARLRRAVWGNDYALALIVNSVPEVDRSGGFAVLGPDLAVALRMNQRSTLPTVEQEIAYSVYAFSTGTSVATQYTIDVAGPGFVRAFDPARDTFEVAPHTALGALLDEIGFTPTNWSVLSSGAGTIGLPL